MKFKIYAVFLALTISGCSDKKSDLQIQNSPPIHDGKIENSCNEYFSPQMSLREIMLKTESIKKNCKLSKAQVLQKAEIELRL